MNDPVTIENQAPVIPVRKARQLRWGLGLAALCFVLGIFLPMITISKFVFIKNSFSVISGVIELLKGGHPLLFILIVGFSVIIPVMKMYVLFKLLTQKRISEIKTERYLHLMHEYGRWAMLDVMVVAILIVTVKLGAIASIEVHVGLFVFGAAVLLIMLITKEVVRLTGTGSGTA